MTRKDKYGRGSAAANGEGFVDLMPGDTFAALEEQLKRRIAERFDNLALGISASIGSKRNAGELVKHLASGEEEEVHKFAAKNIGVLFARGQLGISHDDKKRLMRHAKSQRSFVCSLLLSLPNAPISGCFIYFRFYPVLVKSEWGQSRSF